MNKKGVTLVELIIVIVIIGLISAFAIPAVGRYLETAKKENIYNDALLIENSAKTYCLENDCEKGSVLTKDDLGEYMSNLKSDYTYSVKLLDNDYYAVSYYKEGDYSFPSDGSKLIEDMVPSKVSSSFVNLFGEGGVVPDPEEEFVPPVGEPYVRLSGGSTVYVEYGGSYTEPGYSAYASDGSVISNKWDTGMGNTWTFNTTEIKYSCYSNVDGKACQSATRYVVIVDTTPPEVHVNGSTTVYVNVGSSYTDYEGAWAYDKTNTHSAVKSTSNVNTSKAGTYQITYSSTDSSGNVGTATRTVIVR